VLVRVGVEVAVDGLVEAARAALVELEPDDVGADPPAPSKPNSLLALEADLLDDEEDERVREGRRAVLACVGAVDVVTTALIGVGARAAADALA